MSLRQSPYANRLLGGLDTVLRGLLFPTYWLVNQLLALQQTTAERKARECKRCPPYALQALFTGLALVPALLLSLPFSLVAFLVWLPLQAARRPFAYHHTAAAADGPALPPDEWLLPGKERAFSFITSNLCLLPDGLAKFSNLSQTQKRAKHVGRVLARAGRHSSLRHGPTPTTTTPRNSLENGATESNPLQPLWLDPSEVIITVPLGGQGEAAGPPGEITSRFPPRADFLCLQEVFDPRAGSCMCRLLSTSYGHILYDVGTYGMVGCSNLKLLNSGLFVASRYPVLAAQYHCYLNGTREDALAAKGLFCVQVQVGTSHGKRIVGYLNCTHMHAPEADAEIRCDQLSQGLQWVQQFQEANAQPADVVAFDIFCGDFNFDNCSPGNALEQGHAIFSQYTDPCRLGPRKDKPWAIGTLMDYLEIYDEAVATPKHLKRTLEQPEGRQKFLAGPVLADGQPDLSATCSEGRRLDYILYREHPEGPLALQTVVEKASFITQLASSSDHLPFGLRLLVTCVAHPDV